MKLQRALLPFLAAGLAGTANAQVVGSVGQLADLSLEQLAAIEVTSVSGRVQSLRQAAASVTGRNLFDPGHTEFNAPSMASRLGRRWLLQATLQL